MELATSTESRKSSQGDVPFPSLDDRPTNTKSLSRSRGDVGAADECMKAEWTARLPSSFDALQLRARSPTPDRSDLRVGGDMKYGLSESNSYLVYKPASFHSGHVAISTVAPANYVCAPGSSRSGYEDPIKSLPSMYWSVSQQHYQGKAGTVISPKPASAESEIKVANVQPCEDAEKKDVGPKCKGSLERKKGSHGIFPEIGSTSTVGPTGTVDHAVKESPTVKGDVELTSPADHTFEIAQSLQQLTSDLWPSKEVRSLILQRLTSALHASGGDPQSSAFARVSSLLTLNAGKMAEGIHESEIQNVKTPVLSDKDFQGVFSDANEATILLKCSLCGTSFNCGLRVCECSSSSRRNALPHRTQNSKMADKATASSNILQKIKTTVGRPREWSAAEDAVQVLWKNAEVAQTGGMTSDTEDSEFSGASDEEYAPKTSRVNQKRKLNSKTSNNKRFRIDEEGTLLRLADKKDLDNVPSGGCTEEDYEQPPQTYSLRQRERTSRKPAIESPKGPRQASRRSTRRPSRGSRGRRGQSRGRSNTRRRTRAASTGRKSASNQGAGRVTKRARTVPGSRCSECGRAMPKLGWLSMVGRAIKQAFSSGERPFCSTCWRKMPGRGRRSVQKQGPPPGQPTVSQQDPAEEQNQEPAEPEQQTPP